MSEITPIPSPPVLPLVGNTTQINPDLQQASFLEFARKYGEVYRLHFPGRTMVMACSHRLVSELCDEKRFTKIPQGVLGEIRNGVHDGLFTARPGEENWGIAHRVLMPAMHDIAVQMVLKFARYGPNEPIPASEDFTRLALDTLALCSMGFRFNSFYSKELHPMIEAMAGFLVESGNRPRRVLPSFFYRAQDAKYWDDIETLRKTAQEVLEARKNSPNDRKDLLNAMLNGVDSKTGKRMSDSSIIDNLITFLIAGHETTSGTLSFAFYRLLKNPDAYQKAQKEVDEVVGKGPITVEHLSKLPYITAILRETLRLDSPIPLYTVVSNEDTLLAGKYQVKKNELCGLFLSSAHEDPAVWGEDAKEFKPERMLDENFNKLPKNAWKPFGNGARACIGRPFAMQEAVLSMAILLQNFNFVMHDPSYNLAIKQTLTIKPDNFYMRAIIRDGLSPTQLEHRLLGGGFVKESSKSSTEDPSASAAKGQKITVLYGSNSGTCESLARRVADDAVLHGFEVDTVDCLDSANGKLPKNQPVVIVTASYEGEPPDNAALFCSWLSGSTDEKLLEGVNYSVFGVGHHDWAQTFHRIPKLVDRRLEQLGATRVAPIGLSDTGAADIFTDFETWEDNVLWPALQKKYSATTSSKTNDSSSSSSSSQLAGLSVEVTSPRTSTLRQDVMEAFVVETRRLTAEGEPVKKHMEIALPSGQTYRAGDYLAVLPINPKSVVQRAMRRFGLAWDAHITIAGSANTPLPTNTSIPAQNVLGAYVELAQPATRRNILTLAETVKDEVAKSALKRYAEERYTSEVVEKRISVLDLLEEFPDVEVPLGLFLSMLPPMRVRQYSISSSPLWNSSHVTITFSVLKAPAKSGRGMTHVGVASTYLDGLERGDRLHVAVRPSHAAFHLPQDAANVPLICVAAGTGISPFRGFVQERAEMAESSGRRLAPALLLFGCRSPGKDDLYREELDEWERKGVVKVLRAYSRQQQGGEGGSDGKGARYVQDLLERNADEVLALWERNARLYICGSRAVGEGVRDAVVRMRMKFMMKNDGDGDGNVTEEEVRDWWEKLRNVRYATDVFD
ncbi:bifunctional P-450:NADPH-P450 reductase [Xylariaceae sp. FL0594]|nr:bifunctional P-450:NADPH-P450 reductase [Xylariaceae sp. FL0594]